MADGAAVVEGTSERRRYWSAEEKRRIVEQLSCGLSVASLAWQHGVNANQLFYWRKLYHAGQLGGEQLFFVQKPGFVPGFRFYRYMKGVLYGHIRVRSSSGAAVRTITGKEGCPGLYRQRSLAS
jgi:hypothetical protein